MFQTTKQYILLVVAVAIANDVALLLHIWRPSMVSPPGCGILFNGVNLVWMNKKYQ